ncbi:hypothetical protein EV401DRAFT_1252159 [Pisolithus croceorrhizus]|nr:hypothetical protein EV401DRAFT_1252159 [Pisolithus croceorrhizus]
MSVRGHARVRQRSPIRPELSLIGWKRSTRRAANTCMLCKVLTSTYCRNRYRGNVKLTGIIYMHCISDNHMPSWACKNFDSFCQFCTEGAAQCVRLVATMWDNQKLDNRAI